MANPLTGDFDVVAQVSPALLNRVLAAQHQMSGDNQLYFHSVRIAVAPGQGHGVHGVVDVQLSTPTISLPAAGGPPVVAKATSAMAAPAVSALLPLPAVELIPSRGLTPPLFSFSGGDSRVSIHYQVMARWRPGADSVAAPEFIHGEVRATVGAEQIISTSANVLKVDLGASDVHVSFSPDSGAHLSSGELNLINQVVRQLVRTSFEPVNLAIALPSGTDTFAPHHWRFKTLPDDAAPAVAILLNMRSDRVPTDAQRDGFDNGFLGAGTDFAIAVGSGFLIPTLRDLIREQIESQVVGITKKFKVSGFGVTLVNVTYEVTAAQEPEVELRPSAVQLTVSVSAEGSGFPSPDIDITLTQGFTLQAVDGSVRLERVGDLGVGVEIGGGIAGWIVSWFKGGIKDRIRDAADAALDSIVTEAAPLVEDALSGLDSLLREVRIPPADLPYRSVDISRDGIIVRGDMVVAEWEDVVVTFDSRALPASHLELDAFESWIPGGTIERFRWRYGDGTTVEQVIDHEHQFIARPQAASPSVLPSLWSQWCLEVSGTRDGSPVAGSNCGLVGPPVVVRTGDEGADDDDDGDSSLPVAVRDKAGRLLAHVDLSGPPPDRSGRRPGVWPANVLVHFAGSDPVATPALLRAALGQSEFAGELLVVAVLDPGTLDGAPVNETRDLPGAHIVWAEDFEGTWAATFDEGSYGRAYLLNPRKGILWRSDGRPEAQALSEALAGHATVGALPPSRRLRPAVREGEPAPDFLFEYGAGTTMALRTLRRRPVIINFFKSWSVPCQTELKRLAALHDAFAAKGWLFLAVNDGEDGGAANRVVEELGLGFRVLADPKRRIAKAYGIRAWPTTITVDERGIVREIRTGVSSAKALDVYQASSE